MLKRASGVLLHISSLPGDYGTGTFGSEAYRFIDQLADSGCKYWQVLPLGPTDQCNSPYASISAFAGNINFIDLNQLREMGLLTEEELTENKYANPYSTAFEFLNATRLNTLYKAYSRIQSQHRDAMVRFMEDNHWWLADYALYLILKEANGGKAWNEWPETLKLHDAAAITEAKVRYADEIDFICFTQWIFSEQWADVRKYGKKRSIELIGDLPIYPAMDSADVWSHRELFDLDAEGSAKNVAGVPPDYFSETGQKWGQALYNWQVAAETNYEWWMQRLRYAFTLYDVVRIDHFRAFSSYWAVPADALTAKEGKWVQGPGMDFFSRVIDVLGDAKIIAEDLGIIDDGVVSLMQQTGFPGMRVMQFGFSDPSDNINLPHNYPVNTVAYTGTHDNNTLLGWLWESHPENREWALNYGGFDFTQDWAAGGFQASSCRALIKALWQSPAGITILPIQDLCGFGSDTKMNVPGVPNGNWAFRITKAQLSQIDWNWLCKQNETYRRFASC